MYIFLFCFRSENWEGLSQNVDITPGARYSYSGYIKLLTLVGDAMYHTVELALSCKNSQTGTYSILLRCRFKVRDVTSDNVHSDMFAQQGFRSAFAFAQSDQNFHCAHLKIAKDAKFLHADNEDTDCADAQTDLKFEAFPGVFWEHAQLYSGNKGTIANILREQRYKTNFGEQGIYFENHFREQGNMADCF